MLRAESNVVCRRAVLVDAASGFAPLHTLHCNFMYTNEQRNCFLKNDEKNIFTDN